MEYVSSLYRVHSELGLGRGRTNTIEKEEDIYGF